MAVVSCKPPNDEGLETGVVVEGDILAQHSCEQVDGPPVQSLVVRTVVWSALTYRANPWTAMLATSFEAVPAAMRSHSIGLTC